MKELLKILIPLLAIFESNGNPNAYNNKENAAGILQIRPIMIKDCNRISGESTYYLKDRWNEEKSYHMAITYLNHYGKKHLTSNMTEEEKIVILARMWNGGPNGWKKKSTLSYGEKIRKLYKGK